jgi:lysozyme
MSDTPIIKQPRSVGYRGIAIMKKFESCRLTAYAATENERERGIWTIGWGHRKGVKQFDICTQEQADQWMVEDIAEVEAGVNRLVTHPINQAQFDALVSFAYNVGLDIDVDTKAEGLGDSTLLKLVNQGEFILAAAEFPKWNKQRGVVLGGLTSRRAAERQLFETPV